jgi:hypothetical protein
MTGKAVIGIIAASVVFAAFMAAALNLPAQIP